MDFYTTLVLIGEDITLSHTALKSPSVSSAIDKRNVDLKKRGKQLVLDPIAKKIKTVRYDASTDNTVQQINKVK